MYIQFPGFKIMLPSCNLTAKTYQKRRIFKTAAEGWPGDLPESWGTTQKKKFWNVTRISFIFEATTSISWLQNYASQLQSDCKDAPQTSRIEDGSGRLVGVLTHQCGVRAALECQDGRWAINRPVGHHNNAADPIYRPIFQTADPIWQ